MYYKIQNQIAQLAFPKFAKEDFSIFDLPKEEQRIIDLFATTSDLIAKMETVKTLVDYDNRTFYANEIGLASGTITNLKMFGILKETGETRKTMLPLGDGLFRECVAKQWELNVPKEKLADTLNAIVGYLFTLSV